MASARPPGGLLGGPRAVLAALGAPGSGLGGSRRSLGALRSALGGLWRAPGRLLEASWTLLGRSWSVPGAILEANGAPQRLLERSWRAPGTLLTAFEDPTLNFMKIIDFHCFFCLRILMHFQVPGAALEASECSWRPLRDLLRPLGALWRPLEASWRPLESFLCLPEGVLEAYGARCSRH